LPEPANVPLWVRFLRQFAGPLIYLLIVALVFDLGLWLFGDRTAWPIEAIAIGLILVLNAALGLYQEYRSESAMARLRAMAGAQAWVLRDGHLTSVPTEEIVPGDWVRLEAGDRVHADGTLISAAGVMLDESILTGESLPVEKGDDAEVYSGTLLTRGKAYLNVTRTGAASAMGRLATMLGAMAPTQTPLERRIDLLGRQIARWVLALATILALIGVIAEGWHRAAEMVIFAVALAVAAVPEGLPAVVTVALALGVERMARRRAVVRRLSAVEALGSVDVIATDKTGTLTENRMDVRSLDVLDVPRSLDALALANHADLGTGVGDPLDLGLLRYVAAHGVDVDQLRRRHPPVSEKTFDSAWKFSRVTVRDRDRILSYVKGAPEVILGRCLLAEGDRDLWIEKADAYAREGFRMLAVAWGEGDTEEGLWLLGLVLFWDSPRPEVPGAIRSAQAAGIRVVMMTGDHPATALTIAHQIGIPSVRVLTGEDLADYQGAALAAALSEVNVFARVHPDQKLRIVEALQAQGHLVAVTGDGVNDAPALKRADVGVAMGLRGSDVSREVADLVLLDDNFATIVGAVEEGRGIYENIQKFLRFLFSTNLSEVLLVAAGAFLAFGLNLRDDAGNLLLPLTAAQILWINLITDGLPALALALDRSPGVMAVPPRPPATPLLDRPSMRFVLAVGPLKALLALSLLGVVPLLGYSTDTTRAVVFHFMAIGQLLLTYPARHTRAHPLGNIYLHAAVIAGVAVQLGAASWPVTASLLGNARLPMELWALVFAASLMSWGIAQGVARFVWRASR
jgi:P-type Ca2+ transporter type 2C